jgi:DNA-binding CsgD family transcriptional regulator
MERLRQSDLQSLLAFARECYTIRSPETFESFIPRLVDALVRLIPATHVTYNEMYPQKSESHNCVNTADLASPVAGRLWELHMNEHPVMVHALQTDGPCTLRISDCWSSLQLHDSGLHNDFYRHYEIEDALCISMGCTLPGVIGVGWHDMRRFTDRERMIADLARPHISQALQNARMASRLREQLEMLQSGIDSMGAGVILCGPHWRIQFISARARRYLEEFFDATRQIDQRLPADLLLWVRQQDTQLSANGDAPQARSPLLLEKGNKRLVVRLLSQPGESLIVMEEKRAAPDAQDAAMLGLTARESEVLNWIACGKTNYEIGVILEMHTATVKKHAEHIFKKIGVENRTAAATVALARTPDAPGVNSR